MVFYLSSRTARVARGAPAARCAPPGTTAPPRRQEAASHARAHLALATSPPPAPSPPALCTASASLVSLTPLLGYFGGRTCWQGGRTCWRCCFLTVSKSNTVVVGSIYYNYTHVIDKRGVFLILTTMAKTWGRTSLSMFIILKGYFTVSKIEIKLRVNMYLIIH